MSPDTIDHITLKLFNFLVDNLGCNIKESLYDDLQDFMLDNFEPFCTRDRNYN